MYFFLNALNLTEFCQKLEFFRLLSLDRLCQLIFYSLHDQFSDFTRELHGGGHVEWAGGPGDVASQYGRRDVIAVELADVVLDGFVQEPADPKEASVRIRGSSSSEADVIVQCL